MNRSSGFVTCLLIAIAVVSCVCSGCCGQPAAPPLEELPPSQGLPDGVALVGIETLPPEAAPEGVTGFTAAVGATYQWEDAVVEMTFIESGSPEQADTVFTQLLNALPSEFAKWQPVFFNDYHALKLYSEEMQFCMVLWRTHSLVFMVSGYTIEGVVLGVAAATGY